MRNAVLLFAALAALAVVTIKTEEPHARTVGGATALPPPPEPWGVQAAHWNHTSAVRDAKLYEILRAKLTKLEDEVAAFRRRTKPTDTQQPSPWADPGPSSRSLSSPYEIALRAEIARTRAQMRRLGPPRQGVDPRSPADHGSREPAKKGAA
jgi:hypothetical protein